LLFPNSPRTHFFNLLGSKLPAQRPASRTSVNSEKKAAPKLSHWFDERLLEVGVLLMNKVVIWVLQFYIPLETMTMPLPKDHHFTPIETSNTNWHDNNNDLKCFF